MKLPIGSENSAYDITTRFCPMPPAHLHLSTPQIIYSGFSGLSRPINWRNQFHTRNRGMPHLSSRKTANPLISPSDATLPWRPTPATSSTTAHGKYQYSITIASRAISQPRATRGRLSSTREGKCWPSSIPACPEDRPATSLSPPLLTLSSSRSSFAIPMPILTALNFRCDHSVELTVASLFFHLGRFLGRAGIKETDFALTCRIFLVVLRSMINVIL